MRKAMKDDTDTKLITLLALAEAELGGKRRMVFRNVGEGIDAAAAVTRCPRLAPRRYSTCYTFRGYYAALIVYT